MVRLRLQGAELWPKALRDCFLVENQEMENLRIAKGGTQTYGPQKRFDRETQAAFSKHL